MAKLDKKIEFNFGKKSNNFPTKRTLNLAAVGKRKSNLKLTIPIVAVCVILLGLLLKFTVLDKVFDMNAMEASNAELQAQIDACNAEISKLEDVVGDYAHYTYSDMTEEELLRADRLDVIELIDTYVMPAALLKSWQLHDNVLAMTVSGVSVNQINAIIANLEMDPMVEHCLVSTATTEENVNDVSAEVTVYLYDNVTEETTGEGGTAQ